MNWEGLITYGDLVRIAISAGILLLFLLFRKIFTNYVFSLLLKSGKRPPSELYSHILHAFKKPMQWLFIIIGINIAARYFPYFDHTNDLFIHLVKSFIIFLASWGLFNLSSSSSLLFSRINKKYNIEIDNILIPFLSKTLRVIIVAISISVIAQEFDYSINGFVAGLGLGGLAFALASKDVLANLFGGVVIIIEKPFTIGDWISTSSVEGIVEDITFRSSKIRTFEQALVTVPNSTLSNDLITNWSKMGKRRVTFNLNFPIDTPKAKLHSVVNQIQDLLKNHPDIHQETSYVAFNEYNGSGIEIMVYFFTKTTDWGQYLKVKEDINFKIMDIFKSEEVSFG